MKLLGVDFGLKRIGLATSVMGLATPFKTIQNNSQVFVVLKQITKDGGIGRVVVGLPLHRDGNETKMSHLVREFGKKLEDETGLVVVFHNEMLSSWEAEEHIREVLGIRDPKRIAEMVDKVAASMVLQEYIDSAKEG